MSTSQLILQILMIICVAAMKKRQFEAPCNMNAATGNFEKGLKILEKLNGKISAGEFGDAALIGHGKLHSWWIQTRRLFEDAAACCNATTEKALECTEYGKSIEVTMKPMTEMFFDQMNKVSYATAPLTALGQLAETILKSLPFSSWED